MKRVLITGANGYLGNALFQKLQGESGLQIRVFLHRPPAAGYYPEETEIVVGDIADYDDVKRATADCDCVFHVAGKVTVSSRDREAVERTNVLGTENICKACAENRVAKLIYVSSSSVLHTNKTGLTTEKDGYRHQPVGLYDETKKQASLLVKAYIAQGHDANIVYPTAIIGAPDNGSNLSNAALTMPIRTRKNGILFTFGANDFVDLADVVNGMILVWQNGKAGEDYILSGHFLSLAEIGRTVNALRGGKMKCVSVPLFAVKIACAFTSLYSRLTGKQSVLTKESVVTVSEHARYSHAKADVIGYTARPIEETIQNALLFFNKKR